MDNFNGYYDYELRILTKEQKIGIASTATLLLAMALIFNVFAFSAHMKRFYHFYCTNLLYSVDSHFVDIFFCRKMRPLFRACLISLTVSDMITVVFMYANNISQMTNDLSGIWVNSKFDENKTNNKTPKYIKFIDLMILSFV